MNKYFFIVALLFLSTFTFADVTEINFLIPGGEGGGWDTTARQTGATLIETGLIKNATYRNFSGGGGGRALMDLVNNEHKHPDTLMVQSTPLILRNITGVIAHSYRDIKPVSIMIAEFQVVAVPTSSPFKNIEDFVTAIKKDVAGNRILGGSAKGSLDHITTALILQAAGIGTKKMRYIASDGGGDALERLYKGDGVALVTGYGEIVDELKSGKLRVLGITGENRVPGVDIPTIKEQGYDVVFANWRGFFARPTISSNQFADYENILNKLVQTPAWEQTREKYGWVDFYKSGDEMLMFLANQETAIRDTLKSLGF